MHDACTTRAARVPPGGNLRNIEIWRFPATVSKPVSKGIGRISDTLPENPHTGGVSFGALGQAYCGVAFGTQPFAAPRATLCEWLAGKGVASTDTPHGNDGSEKGVQ